MFLTRKQSLERMGAASSKKLKKTNTTTQQQVGKWTQHPNHATYHIANKIVQIKDSIWYSTDYKHGEKGMVEYCLMTNTIKRIVKYPDHIKPSYHCICTLNDIIYIIDGFHGGIISFDSSNNKFGSKIEMKNVIGDYSSAVTINGKIHIYNGMYNDRSTSYIYHPKTNQIKSVNDKFASRRISNVAVVNYPWIANKLFRFGGYNNDSKSPYLNTFLVRIKIKEL